MYKEIIISLIILVCVIALNTITQNYTKESLDIMRSELLELKEELIKEEIDKNKLNEKIEKASYNWEERQEKLAYYLEHDELEKVETRLTEVKSNIEIDEVEKAVVDLDACTFVLEHIEDKESFKLKNIF